MKESYNPFKMWGSYLGIVIALFFLFVFPARMGENIYVFDTPPEHLDGHHFSCLSTGIAGGSERGCDFLEFLRSLSMIIVYIIVIVGFLVGWGVHSLIRKLT